MESILYSMIFEKIKKNEEWLSAYKRIPLKFQTNMMKIFIENLPKLDYLKKYKEYFRPICRKYIMKIHRKQKEYKQEFLEKR